MKFLFAVVSLFAAHTLAATITAYSAKNCVTPLGACKQIPQNACCKGAKFASARASGIGKKQFFGLFQSKNDGGTLCDFATAAQAGPGCLTGKGGKQDGALYASPERAIARRDPDSALAILNATECTESVDMNFVFLENREFHVNYHVPRDESEALIALAERGASLAEVPDHLLKWEYK